MSAKYFISFAIAVAVLNFVEFKPIYRYLEFTKRKDRRKVISELLEKRTLSVYLGNGVCNWTEASPLGPSPSTSGLLLAAFPGSGMRLTWQHTEGLTSIQVGDDFMLAPDAFNRTGIIKTQYPNLEGIWSWGSKMDRVILVVRNPRWAIPSYHTLLAEIHYAHDWETAYQYLDRLFTVRPTEEAWVRWRDYRFHEEVYLWKMFIDYWMEGGKQYWMDLDFERNGQYPFRWLNESEYKTDLHCIYDMDCHPKTVISYERLRDNVTGPVEANKIAKVIENMDGLTVIEEDGRACVWRETEKNKKLPDNNSRDTSGKTRDMYGFTYHQLLEIREALVEMKNKYSSGSWINNLLALDLVTYFDSYIEELDEEIAEIESGTIPPTQAPNAEHEQALIDWYKSIGRGDRYNKAKVQSSNPDMYAQMEHLY